MLTYLLHLLGAKFTKARKPNDMSRLSVSMGARFEEILRPRPKLSRTEW